MTIVEEDLCEVQRSPTVLTTHLFLGGRRRSDTESFRKEVPVRPRRGRGLSTRVPSTEKGVDLGTWKQCQTNEITESYSHRIFYVQNRVMYSKI